MNVTTSNFSLTQLIIAWTLLGLLLSWLIIFSVLALHVFVMKKGEWEDLPMHSRSYPTISVQPAQLIDTQRQYVRVATGDMLPDGTNAETSRDIGTAPIK